MKYRFTTYVALLLLIVAMQAYSASEALARAVPFSFDSVWFYRDGTRVVPEISKQWLTVVFDPHYSSTIDDVTSATLANDGFIRKKARAIIKSLPQLSEFFHDPNLAEDACFFRMRPGVKPGDITNLISRLKQDATIRYVHPALVINNKTFAYFNQFELEWKTGTDSARRATLLGAAHVVADENDEKGKRYLVDVASIPFFKAINLLAEDVRVLKVTPHLVEIKPSISVKLSLFMNGGNIGDSVPFSLTISFTDRVNIDPSSISTLNLRPPELQKELFDCVFDPYDYARAVTKSPVVITGRITLYAPGEYTIPPVKIGYSCPSCSDKGVRSIESEPALFLVSSIIPDARSEYRLIVPTVPVAPVVHQDTLDQQPRLYLWLAIICGVGLSACAVWTLLLFRTTGADPDRLEERKKEAQLVELLRAQLHATPSTPHWKFLGEVGALLREYLLLHYGIDVKYQGGGGHRFMETLAERIPAESGNQLRDIFAAIDTCVTLEAEHFQDIEQLTSAIQNIVEPNSHNDAGRG
ncbi:MAG: hypothetical protein HXX11_16360 [Desulfuromonadales bacterium]|nr:hypothetical protein [Desulfuromonadales bacterium]